MNDFTFQNTTKVYFGRNQLQHLHEEVLKYGKKFLWHMVVNISKIHHYIPM